MALFYYSICAYSCPCPQNPEPRSPPAGSEIFSAQTVYDPFQTSALNICCWTKMNVVPVLCKTTKRGCCCPHPPILRMFVRTRLVRYVLLTGRPCIEHHSDVPFARMYGGIVPTDVFAYDVNSTLMQLQIPCFSQFLGKFSRSW